LLALPATLYTAGQSKKKDICAAARAEAMRRAMRNESLVLEVVALVQMVREKQALQARGAGLPPAELAEVFENIVCQCDALMSSMLSSPLTGRMHADPGVGLTPEAGARTLAAALQL